MKIKCNVCHIETNHELKAVHIRDITDEYDESNPHSQPSYFAEHEYRFWVCLGCDTACLQEVFEITDYEETFTSTYYPRRIGKNKVAKEFRQLDKKLSAIYKEVIGSYNAGLNITCAMGLRALLEGVCINKGITDKEAWGLEAKLNKLDEDKHLPSNIVECLHSFKFIGDAAAHRLESPREFELELAINVIEDLLNFVYEVEYQLILSANKLANRHTSQIEELRKKKAKKSKSNPNLSSATSTPSKILSEENNPS